MNASIFGTRGIVHHLFILGMFEAFGLMVYVQFTAKAAWLELRTGGIQLNEILPFLLASPDRALVAVGLAVLAVVLVNTGHWRTRPA